MDDRDLRRDADFDGLLAQLPPPPETVVEGVTPWRRSMDRVLWGIALTTLTLNVWCLDTILPAIGLVLMLLGFRALRRENPAFGIGYALAIARLALFCPMAVWQATIWPLPGGEGTATVLTLLGMGMQIALCLCLGLGLSAVRREAGLTSGFGRTVGLLVWYAALICLAMVSYAGLLVLLLLAVYLLLIRSLFGLSHELDEAGYAIRPAPVRVSDGALALAIAAAMLAALALAYTFGRTFPMDWTPAEPSDNAAVESIRADLRALGFPDVVLADLADADILACRGAVRVVVDETRDHPLNAGRSVTEQRGNTYYSERVYDQKELRLRGVSVELPDGTWRLFHHFTLTDETRMYGTESICLRPAYRENDRGWRAASDVGGRLLCTQDGRPLTAPYYRLGAETYTQSSIFRGDSRRHDIFAEFSLPNKATARRGYLTYAVAEQMPGGILSSWVTYTHQRTWRQYPARTAKAQSMLGRGLYDGAFAAAQDAIQFFPAYTE